MESAPTERAAALPVRPVELSRLYSGAPKAQAIINEINMMFGNVDLDLSFDCDIHKKNSHAKAIDKELKSVDLILDTSASFSVLRNIATNDRIRSRIVSAYMGDRGKSSVLLIEERNRKIRIDDLDIELKVLALYDKSFKKIFEQGAFESILYATGCSQQTSIIPQDHIALHGAQIARYIKKAMTQSHGEILITNLSDNGYSVESKLHKSHGTYVVEASGWQFRISNFAKAKMVSARQEKLPNETGGVLIGAIDYYKKVVYIGDILTSPADSEEWPTSYIRGCKNLQTQVERIFKLTNGDLNYIGEWHSHPNNCSVKLSKDDQKALEWIKSKAIVDGTPGIMVIIGDNEKVGCNIAIQWKTT